MAKAVKSHPAVSKGSERVLDFLLKSTLSYLCERGPVVCWQGRCAFFNGRWTPGFSCREKGEFLYPTMIKKFVATRTGWHFNQIISHKPLCFSTHCCSIAPTSNTQITCAEDKNMKNQCSQALFLSRLKCNTFFPRSFFFFFYLFHSFQCRFQKID